MTPHSSKKWATDVWDLLVSSSSSGLKILALLTVLMFSLKCNSEASASADYPFTLVGEAASCYMWL